MFSEKWVPLNLSDKFKESSYSVVGFSDYSAKGFVITYEDENDNTKKIEVHFGFAPASYRVTYETYMWPFSSKASTEASYIYSVTNSNYIKWLDDISNSISSDMEKNMKHFVFFTGDDFIEVLASCEPDIKLIGFE